MARSDIFLLLCLSFVLGIFLASFILISRLIWLGFLILATVLIVWGGLARQKTKLIGGLLVLFLTLGIIRFWMAEQIDSKAIEKLFEQTFDLEGIVASEPERTIAQQKFQIQANEVYGKILVLTDLFPPYDYGDKLKIRGRLKEPKKFEDFDYRAYLQKDGIYYLIYSPEIELMARHQGNLIYQKIFSFKDKLRKIIDEILKPPQSNVLKAIIWGGQDNLSEKLKEELNKTGVRHIVSVSGTNMVIVSEVLLFMALGLGLWRNQAFYLVLSFLALYIVMTGAPASAIRAGLMTGLLLLSQKIGRTNNAGRAVVFAGVIMFLINPLFLRYDVGFQLSFMAVGGLIYLKPVLDKLVRQWPNPLGLKDVLTMTFAAQIAVWPILVFNFNQLSLISPLANLLIVPIVPFVTIFGMVLCFVGLLYLPLAKILVFPLWLALSYVLEIVGWLAMV